MSSLHPKDCSHNWGIVVEVGPCFCLVEQRTTHHDAEHLAMSCSSRTFHGLLQSYIGTTSSKNIHPLFVLQMIGWMTSVVSHEESNRFGRHYEKASHRRNLSSNKKNKAGKEASSSKNGTSDPPSLSPSDFPSMTPFDTPSPSVVLDASTPPPSTTILDDDALARDIAPPPTVVAVADPAHCNFRLLPIDLACQLLLQAIDNFLSRPRT